MRRTDRYLITSPGNRLAHESCRNVYVRQVASAEPLVVTFRHNVRWRCGLGLRAAWSGVVLDGKAVCYCRAGSPGGAVGCRGLVPGPGIRNACLSGGGNPIVYVSESDGNREIYVVDPQTGESSRLTSNSAPDDGPRWSPDGQSIAYVSRESGDKEIHVMDREGLEDKRLTRNPGLDGSPRWSPERQMLAYVSEAQEDGEQGSDLFSISLESLEVDQVTFEAPTEELGDWSPDGEWLIFYNVGSEEDRGLWLRNPTGVNLLRLTEGRIPSQAGHPTASTYPSSARKKMHGSSTWPNRPMAVRGVTEQRKLP